MWPLVKMGEMVVPGVQTHLKRAWKYTRQNHICCQAWHAGTPIVGIATGVKTRSAMSGQTGSEWRPKKEAKKGAVYQTVTVRFTLSLRSAWAHAAHMWSSQRSGHDISSAPSGPTTSESSTSPALMVAASAGSRCCQSSHPLRWRINCTSIFEDMVHAQCR